MFLGVPPDYRNEAELRNAVSTFGTFHYWNSHDPFLSRALVYATFPSVQTVPRDVVFGKFANLGGARHSWTAPVYVLTAEFADALPADEDPMPLDGNPHPMPGHMAVNNHMWVLPQFPEIGWNVVPMEQDNDQHQQDAQEIQNDQQQEEGNWVQPEADQGSMILDPADSDDGEEVQGNLQLAPLGQQQMQDHWMEDMQVGMVLTVYGPVVPPDMQWKNVLDMFIP